MLGDAPSHPYVVSRGNGGARLSSGGSIRHRETRRLDAFGADDHEGGFLSVFLHADKDPASRHELIAARSTFDRYAVTSDRIIRELALIGFGNIDDFVAAQDDGSLVVDFGTATREQMASLKSIEIDERMVDGTAAGVRKVKISMSDKRQALMDLAKIARLLPADRHEHSGPGGGPIAFDVKPEHKINIEAMTPEEREQLRTLLLAAVRKGPITDVEPEEV